MKDRAGTRRAGATAKLTGADLWFLQGGGLSGAAARAHDWTKTPLGSPADWPSVVKTTVATMFAAQQPMFLWWGEALTQFYNDAYLPSFGEGKHPQAMGQPGRECWGEIWDIIFPQIEDVMQRKRSTWHEDALIPIRRNGRLEEVYWSYSYSPVFCEDGTVGGTLVICTETTQRVQAERRAAALHTLATATATATLTASDNDALMADVLGALAESTHDAPYTVLCERDAKSQTWKPRRLRGLSEADAAHLCAQATAPLFGQPCSNSALITPIDNLRLDDSGESLREAYLAPLSAAPAETCILFGLHPRVPFDEPLQRFLDQVAAQVLTAAAHLSEVEQRVSGGVALQRAHTERAGLLRNLEEASRAKDEFLAMLGHELRNPLSPIVTALQLMRSDDTPPSREQRVIERQVQHLIRLVDDLLDVAKIARGKVELRRELVDLRDILNAAAEMASDLLEQREHRLSIACKAGRFLCYADRVRLSQVVANLLTNAARYTERGGHIRVRVGSAERGDNLFIEVADNGTGIPPEMLPKLFTLFEQGRRSADRAQGGLGIGLSLVKNLTELHGGNVVAHSDGVGKGSTFTVWLPAARDSAPPPHETGKMRVGRLAQKKKRVLVVDDNVDAAELLAVMLQRAGHEAVMSSEPLDALEVARQFLPQVAILDIGLPVIDGYELAQRLRQLPEGENCRLIALSGYGQHHDRERSRAAGFEEHLTKPVPFDTLLQRIDLDD